MEELVEIVIKRLEEKGMDETVIPSFIRDVANISLSTDSNLPELNRRLQSLGWDEFELDDHTLQQIEAVIENNCFKNRIEVKDCIITKDFSIPLLFQQPQPM